MTPATMLWEGPKANPNDSEARLYGELREARDLLRRRATRRPRVESRLKQPVEGGIGERGGTGRPVERANTGKHRSKAGTSGHPRGDAPRPRTPSDGAAKKAKPSLRPPPYAPSAPPIGRHVRFGDDGRILGGGGKNKKGDQTTRKV